MWIAQDPDKTPLTTLTFWLWASSSAPCVDGAAPAQALRIPHMDCANHWHCSTCDLNAGGRRGAYYIFINPAEGCS